MRKHVKTMLEHRSVPYGQGIGKAFASPDNIAVVALNKPWMAEAPANFQQYFLAAGFPGATQAFGTGV